MCSIWVTSGYKTNKEIVSSFEFPIKRPQLMKKCIVFVNRRNWTPSKSSVICIKHFKDDFINFGKKNTLKWKLEPFPIIHTQKTLKRSSTLQTSSTSRKLPKVRMLKIDKIRRICKT